MIEYEVVRYENDHNGIVGWKKGDVKEYKLVNVTYCCCGMGEAFEERYIHFGEHASILNRDNKVNIFKCFPFTEGAAWEEMPIRYCPFCAEEVQTQEIHREHAGG